MMFCVFGGHFLTPVDPIRRAWERNCKIFGTRFPGPPGELDRATFPISKRFGRCPDELDISFDGCPPLLLKKRKASVRNQENRFLFFFGSDWKLWGVKPKGSHWAFCRGGIIGQKCLPNRLRLGLETSKATG